MKNEVIRFLKRHYTSDPFYVDRLFVSAFLKENELEVNNNVLLKSYCIGSDEEEETLNLFHFLEVLKKNDVLLDFENLISLFEFVVSPADRIVNGAIYTPFYIREFIIKNVLEELDIAIEHLKIADISCGCGGFLFNMAKELRLRNISFSRIFSTYIWGLDIQEYSIVRTKLLLSLLALSEGEDVENFNFNLYVGDALNFNWGDQIEGFQGFNIIVGNPPYVRLRNLPDDTKELLKNWEVCRTGLTDLYIPFFQIAIENLSLDGILGYITMNSFFKSLNARALREYFHRNLYSLKIIDFGCEQIFKSRNTYTCICFVQKQPRDFVEYVAAGKENLDETLNLTRINYNNLNAFNGWNLRSNEIIRIIESTGRPFGHLYKTRHGIATLKNNIYIFKPVAEDEDYYYRQGEKGLIAIEKKICKSIINPNKLGDGKTIAKLEEKIIFPYSDSTRPKLISEDLFASKYPCAYNYLTLQKEILKQRDKGKGKYENWFAFGRTQSLERVSNKLFFPKISNRPPNCTIASDDDLFYYNGQAIIGHTIDELILIQKLMKTKIFWFYITNTSKPYSSNYYSLNGNYISNFGVCEMNEEEKKYVIQENDIQKLDSFFEKKYHIKM